MYVRTFFRIVGLLQNFIFWIRTTRDLSISGVFSSQNRLWTGIWGRGTPLKISKIDEIWANRWFFKEIHQILVVFPSKSHRKPYFFAQNYRTEFSSLINNGFDAVVLPRTLYLVCIRSADPLGTGMSLPFKTISPGSLNHCIMLDPLSTSGRPVIPKRDDFLLHKTLCWFPARRRRKKIRFWRRWTHFLLYLTSILTPWKPYNSSYHHSKSPKFSALRAEISLRTSYYFRHLNVDSTFVKCRIASKFKCRIRHETVENNIYVIGNEKYVLPQDYHLEVGTCCR